MIYIAEKANSRVKFLLAPRNYTGLYNQLRQFLPEHLLALFAKPIQKSNATAWYADVSEDHISGSFRAYNQLSDEEKNEVSDFLENRQREMASIFEDKVNFNPLFKDLFTIPEEESIYVAQTAEGLQAFMLEWGCQLAAATSEANPLTRIISRPRPSKTKVEIVARNADGTIAANKAFTFEVNSFPKTFTTNKEGKFNLGLFPVGIGFDIYELIDGEQRSIHHFIVAPEQDYHVTFEALAVQTEAQIIVQDQHGNLLPDYPLVVRNEHHSEEQQQISNTNGLISIPPLTSGSVIQAYIPGNPSSLQQFVVNGNPAENTFYYKVVIKEPEWVKVMLVNHKNKPLPAVPIDFFLPGHSKKIKITDEEGKVSLSKSYFQDQDKVRADVILEVKGKKKGEEKKQKKIRKRFIYKNNQNEYVLKLRKFNWLWLLLLLPLLLLVQCEKEVYVQVQDAASGELVDDAAVTLGYQHHYIFSSGNWLDSDPVWMDEQTNTFGVSHFIPLKYSVYSTLFFFRTRALISGTSICQATDTITPLYHTIWNKDTLVLQLHPRTNPIDFIVVDKEDQEPLPEAKVVVESEYLGQTYESEAISDLNGRVVFDDIPYCGLIKKIRGALAGFKPDSMLNKTVEELSDDLHTNRKLELDPINEPIEFFVVDCNTGQSIPGATVIVDLDYGNRKEHFSKKTNVNGVGKGIYEDAWIEAGLTLKASAPPNYRDTIITFPSVKSFINQTAEERTICIQPVTSTIEFNNTDELSGQPIAGVENIVKIINGDQVIIDTIYSNGEGNFLVGVNPGDQVSIISDLPPDYERTIDPIEVEDGHWLKDRPDNERNIPLKPKMEELLFRTIDAENHPIPDTDLDITVELDGKDVSSLIDLPTKSNQNGEFLLNVPLNSKVSVVAEKEDYGSNTSKIEDSSIRYLINAPQEDRDIPLIPTIPCNEVVEAGKGYSPELYFQLGNKDYEFTLFPDMKGHPDVMTIYCGKGKSGAILFKQEIKEEEFMGTKVKYPAQKCQGIITVVIEPTANSLSSEWDFQISCPR